MAKMNNTVRKGAVDAMLDLIFNGDWTSVEEFDERFDEQVEYFNSIQESVDGFIEVA